MDADSTLFDLASLSKIVASTAATAWMVDRGYLSLNEPLASPNVHSELSTQGFLVAMDSAFCVCGFLVHHYQLLGPDFAASNKSSITVLNCLLHNAGFPADPNPNYWDPAFGCPPSTSDPPQPTPTCRQKIYQSLMDQTLDRAPGVGYVYSDLSMISMMFVIGRVASAHQVI